VAHVVTRIDPTAVRSWIVEPKVKHRSWYQREAWRFDGHGQLDRWEIMATCSRLRSLTGRPGFPGTGETALSIGATGDADGEAAMRTERSHPWGFDAEDPRLELRRAAAEAQRDTAADETPDADDVAFDDFGWTDMEDWGRGRAGGATAPRAPAISRS
jgi:hypothetical protein